MKKYTANYVYTNPNFVIQNLAENKINNELLPFLYVTKNILQRGFPTTPSVYLKDKLGNIHNDENFQERLLFVTTDTPIWYNTIKGNKEKNYYPAKDFYEKIIPNDFGEYSFIQSLIIPEIQINEILGEENRSFVNQQVDFYLPQAKLIIEIDGQQHKTDKVLQVSDNYRDNYLLSRGITTIRINTDELKNDTYKIKVETILNHLRRYHNLLNNYKNPYHKIKKNQISQEEINNKLLPTAIIRFQILLIELLIHKHITFQKDWNFNILSHEQIPDFAELAIEDTFLWINNLWKLKNKQELIKPNYNIQITNNKNKFQPSTKTINIDFSLLKRYTDESETNKDIIFVRTDYFDNIQDRNYFRVSTTHPINYDITEEDIPVLKFFLNNIFNKPSFREGQFSIIANALNRKDTIGLLPTGAGKSLCYQLPCLLQPSINFIVCPIKSLMQDQYESLKKISITNINYITSDFEAQERRDIESKFEQGRYLLVWISPEKFQIPQFRNKVTAIIAKYSISYAVVDEVHCLSEWGHDFRTSYLNLTKTIDKLSPKDKNGEGKIKFIGLTATASINVLTNIKIEFSRQKASLEDENIKSLLDYSREELRFEVINDNGNKMQILKELIENLKQTENFIHSPEKAGIIFTPNINGDYGCYPISNNINTIYQDKVSWYSGEVPKVDELDDKGKKTGNKIELMSKKDFNQHKQTTQKYFKENKYPLLVATKAFGMGIDKENIHYTFHYGLPSSIEAFYQEAGRAGRWDKNKKENQNKIGKCYLLYSPETYNTKKVQRLFHKDTTFAEMKKISDEVGRGGKDIFKQVFLFASGQNDIEKDYQIILDIIHNYYKEKSKVTIYWNKVREELKIQTETLQKAIYRLSLLGIATDWTTDFINHYEVQFESTNENHIIKNITNYIKKYEPNADIKSELQKVQKDTILEKAIWYLLKWTFDNIAFSRKESLKTLSEWCNNFKDSDNFKRRLDSYFQFTEATFILQHINDNPREYKKWFEALYLIQNTKEHDEEGNQIKIKTHIPAISEEEKRNTEYSKLRDGISRFYESSKGKNDGINFLLGFIHLALDEFENERGKNLFESTLISIKNEYIPEQKSDILTQIKILGEYLSQQQKIQLTQSLTKYYPEILQELAEHYDLVFMLENVYTEKIKHMKTLNKKLYEQLTEI